MKNEDFVVKMNNLSKEWGMKNTKWINPSGLGEGKEYSISTPYDICLLMCHIIKSEQLLKIMQNEIETININNKNIIIKSLLHNKIIKDFPILGGKTVSGDGFFTIAFYTMKNNKPLVICVMGSDSGDNRFNDIIAVLKNTSPIVGSYCVMDPLTMSIVSSKNEHKQYPPMSITKILTCYIGSKENQCRDEEKVIITKEDIQGTEKTSGCLFKEGDIISKKDLLKAAIMVSSNQAANAIARTTTINFPKNDLKKQIIECWKKRKKDFNINNPQTIQEKINWLKINDVTPLKSLCADKIRVHEYSLTKLGKDICVPIIKVYDSVEDISLDELPEKFVLKCNHGWNMNIICADKHNFDIKSAKENLKIWLNTDFGKKSGQLHYSNIEKKCYAEKFMEDEIQTESLFDYKFWCFNGEPKLYTINNEHGHGDILYYDMNGTPIDVYGKFNNKYPDFKKPSQFNQMIEYAKKLSEDFKFVRVDFYEVDGYIYLGELTFTPGNGNFRYKDQNTEIMIGNLLNL